MKRTILTSALVAAAAFSMSACTQEASGQVAAVVNGDEITLQEINAELAAANVPEGADKKDAQRAALQRIVDRRLIAQAAKDDGLDETPDYLIRRRQLDDALLVQLMSQRTERTAKVPDQAAIDQFIAQNGQLFGQRTIYTVDRIQFATPKDFSRLQILEDAHSMEAVASMLNRLNIEFERGGGQMDSLQLGPERNEQIRALPSGEPFVIPEGNVVTVGVITNTRTEPLTGEDARPVALQMMRARQTNDSLQQRLKTAKSQAEIEYQDGFAPPKPAKR
ncbi:MAG: SurA N-terminal domain-containing protein [Pontixanthobacter sp.]